ncbi:MAG: BMP family ABC transporter substrate-binding protein [Bacilli bacterium]|nr:BMP family ABC transporter substrate-binding protein [Bacilli bacterium]
MKKLLTSVLTTALLVGAFATLTGCGAPKTYELALVTDVGDIDDESFNQSSWEALKDYAEQNNKTYDYYRPTEDSTDARVKAIKQAITKGAKVVVCPGYLFEEAIYNVQDEHPDVKFLLLDGEPHTPDYATYKTADNTACVLYQEQVAGYLAGYAAVMDGYRSLGFCGGMAVPAVQRFGTGYLQGIDAAAQALNVEATVNYYYAGAFQATDDATAKMKEWYKGDTEIVFACGGKVYQSVVEGCKERTDGKWIGVDVDQVSVDPERVLTSATKGLRASVQSALELYYADKWSEIGGKTANLGLGSNFGSLEARDYVGIPTVSSSWKFASYQLATHEALVAQIGAGTVTISGDVTAAPTLSATTVNYISGFAG